MTFKQLSFKEYFKVQISHRRSQAATMTLRAGQKEGGPDNYHRGSDQWLFVLSGTGVAIVGGKRIRLRKGSLLLIARRVRHEIRNTGRRNLQTLNIYIPKAYTSGGDELPAARGR